MGRKLKEPASKCQLGEAGGVSLSESPTLVSCRAVSALIISWYILGYPLPYVRFRVLSSPSHIDAVHAHAHKLTDIL
ncbi:hypothetical protein BaRGS_00016564, partial [Batillaria attramentaria]